MSYVPCCVVCGKKITWTFWVCANCEEEWDLPKRYIEWPEWLKFLVKEEAKVRDRMTKVRIKNGNEDYIVDHEQDGFYVMDIEEFLSTKFDFAGYITVTSDGIEGYDFPDSDWEAVYSYSI